MPPPRRGAKKTRGQIRSGLVAIVSARLRRFLLAIMTNRTCMLSGLVGRRPRSPPFRRTSKFLTRPPNNHAEALYRRLLTRPLSTLTSAACTPTDDVLQLLRTIVPGRDPREHAGRDAQVQRVQDAAIAVDDDEDQALHAIVVSESSSPRSVADLIVDVDDQDDGLAPVVLLQEMEEFEVVSVSDGASGC